MAGVARILSKCFPNGIIYRSFSQKAVNLKKTPQDYPALTGSEHWRRKIRTLFKARDVDCDGYITKKDYEMHVHRVISYMNLNENQAQDLKKWKMFSWELLSGTTEASADFRLPEHDYVSNMLAAYPVILERIVDVASCDFDTIDVDGDGFISPQEHKACFYGFGIPLKHSTNVFKVLDTDGDGKISREDYVQGFVDYILSEDENSPHACFFGPLVQ